VGGEDKALRRLRRSRCGWWLDEPVPWSIVENAESFVITDANGPGVDSRRPLPEPTLRRNARRALENRRVARGEIQGHAGNSPPKHSNSVGLSEPHGQ